MGRAGGAVDWEELPDEKPSVGVLTSVADEGEKRLVSEGIVRVLE